MKDPLYDQTSLVFRFKKHIQAQGLIKKSRRMMVACSGGPDSVALFHLIRVLYPQAQIALAHFNHKLRSSAGRDEKFVKNIAKQYGAKFFGGIARDLKHAKNKLSLEEAARLQRYEFFKKTFRFWRADVVLLAHHLDDQAETVLMRLCQGTGLRGLLGIRAKILMESMPVERPLLAFSKEELVLFLKKHKFGFCKDETNDSSAHLRNRFRLKVLPLLKKTVNPRVAGALARLPETLEAEQSLIESLQREAWRKVFQKKNARGVVLKSRFFYALHPALQFRILDQALKKVDPGAGLLFENWKIVAAGLGKPRFRVSLPRDIELIASSRALTLRKKV